MSDMMKISIMLESKAVRLILANFFDIKPEAIGQTKYSFTVIGMTPEEVAAKLSELQ